MPETSYDDIQYRLHELDHAYGERVHIVSEPYLLTLLEKLCSPETRQPEVGRLVEQCYRALLIPVILACCVLGSFAVNNRMFDVWVMLAFGLIGFGMERLKIPLAPFVIGFILTPVAEEKLTAALMSSGGSYAPLLTRPVSLVFILISLALLAWPLVRRWRAR